VPELMNMSGMLDEERNNRNLMTDLAVFTKKEPGERMAKIYDLFKQLTPLFQKDNIELEINHPTKAT
jgi:hypothetical protein